MLELRFCSVVPADVRSTEAYSKFKILTPSNVQHIVLEADTAEDAMLWVDALKRVCKTAVKDEQVLAITPDGSLEPTDSIDSDSLEEGQPSPKTPTFEEQTNPVGAIVPKAVCISL